MLAEATSVSASSLWDGPINRIKSYGSPKGDIANFINKAYRIVGDDPNGPKGVFYLSKKSLVKNLVRSPNPQVTGENLKNISRIHDLVLENLNPIIGEPIRYSDVKDFFARVRTPRVLQLLQSCLSDESASCIITEKLEEIRQPHLERIPYDLEVLKQKLQPGDIFCCKIHDGVVNGVVVGQTIEKHFLRKPLEREAYKFSHIAIYIGNGLIAEAAWPTGRGDELRILSLSDRRFSMIDHPGFHYVVTRCKDPEIAAAAAEVAERIADRVACLECEGNQKTRLRYSIPLALKCILMPASFSSQAKEQYLEQYLDDKAKQLPRTFQNPTGMFCSYFVALAFQTAESRKIVPKILDKEDELEMTDIKAKSCWGAIKREIWATMKKYEYYHRLESEVRLKFNSRRISPQYLRNFMVHHCDLFEDKYVITRNPTYQGEEENHSHSS